MDHDKFSEIYGILKAFAQNAPSEPGVYIWKDSENRIIYVGKARILKNRLGSYFSGTKDVKTIALIRHAKTIETIIVSNEYEALLLENTLIKQHSPKYNINLKDGKTYPVVRITADEFPRVFRTRHIVEDGSQYFGPFPNVRAVDRTLDLIEKLFPMRKCRTLKKRNHPCLYYHLKRCLAPCCKEVPEYKIQVERVKKILSGESSSLITELNAKMNEYAQALKFEEAAEYRNLIQAIETLSENNSVTDMDSDDRDYISWATEGIFTTFSVLSMRAGRMTGHELFNSRSAAQENESLETFIAAYYSPDRPPPPRIYLGAETKPGIGKAADVEAASGAETTSSAEPDSATGESEQVKPILEGTAALNRFFTEQFNFAPEIIISKDCEKKHIAALAIAWQNAQEELRRRLRERGAGPALDELKRTLNLKTRPERIEGFDISHIGGKHPVASLISFKNGVPDRKNYRYFKLKTTIGIVDDFASIREAVHRRYSRLVREANELPDLILIDGGIGQVNAARLILDELGISCDVAGLAKRDEEIWLPHASQPIKLSRRSEALKVLQFVRDETHRFATGLNQRLRSKDLYFPTLESIEGIGPKRATAIMKTYGGLKEIAAADVLDIAEKCSLSETAARAVRAAAKLALEDQDAKKKTFTAKNTGTRGTGVYSRLKNTAASIAAEAALSDDNAAPDAIAAEKAPDYE